MTGCIVILNGAPRSGKSSIAAALQATSGLWLNLGVDAMMAMTPEHLRPGIGLRPGGERPDLEPVVRQLYGTLFEQLAVTARAGTDVVSDLGLHDDYATPLDILGEAMRRLSGLPVLFIGVRCPIEIIMARRNADPQGGYYAAGDSVPAAVARWQQAVHRDHVYDLELDTSLLTPAQCATAIVTTLQHWPQPTAFEQRAPKLPLQRPRED
jgi:chloramphenicol 3-O phosphotransferase